MSSHPNETSPLLADSSDRIERGTPNGDGDVPHLPFLQRVKRALKAEGEPTWGASFRWFIFGSWLNILLAFVPLSFLSHFLGWDAALRFTFSFIAIVPLAKVCHCCFIEDFV